MHAGEGDAAPANASGGLHAINTKKPANVCRGPEDTAKEPDRQALAPDDGAA